MENLPTTFITDLAIVGGGPAGSAAAIAAAGFGLQTIVLERNVFPRDKICGDGVMHTTMDILEQFGQGRQSLQPFVSTCPYMTLHGPGNEQHQRDALFDTIPRVQLDEMLWKQIPEMVQKKENVQISSMEKQGDHFLLNCKGPDGIFTVKSKYLVGADGYSSLTKRTFFPSLKYPVRIASRCYLELPEFDANTFEFYFEADLVPGYFWCFKTGKHQYNTGVFLPEDSSLNIFETHQRYVKKYFGVTITKENFHTWSIPGNIQLDAIAANGVILAGDAGGLCDRLFGHGIDMAIVSGYAAAQSVHYSMTVEQEKYPFSEIYRYNLERHLKGTLQRCAETYSKVEQNKEQAVQIISNFIEHEMPFYSPK